LADFGGAIICSPRETDKVHAKKVSSCKLIRHQQTLVTLLTLFKGAVSPGYVAADVERFFKNNTADRIPARDARPGITLADIPRRVTTATNVWNAGLIILDLMSPRHFDPPKWWTQVYDARDAWLDNIINRKDTDPRMKGYSTLLKDTVIQCLNYDPSQRPTPKDLLARVDQGVNLHGRLMQTRDCLDTKKYNGQYDLDPRVAFSDDYPITQPEDWTMADEDDDVDEDFPTIEPGGGPTPKTPQGKAQARPSNSATAGAPQDTPFKGFVFGPNAGEATRDLFDTDADYEMIDRPEPRHDFFKKSGMREAMEDEMPDGQDVF
jgi:serine/threonine protein kinase